MAVNFWWDHYTYMKLMKESACRASCDPSLTLDQVELMGQESVYDDVNSIRYVPQVTVELFLMTSTALGMCHRSPWSCF